jgi:NADPH:quinone reductase
MNIQEPGRPTMRAVTFSSFGGPDRLAVADIPIPEPGAGQVRIRVAAAPVHPADLFARSGAMAALLPSRPYYVLGWDVAGTVDTVGPGVGGFAPGDPVVGMSDWLATNVGTQAEFVVLDAAALAPAPSGIALTAASTLPVNALTALAALDRLDLREGQTLAVTGAGGAVGGYAVELARHRGIRTVALGAEQDEGFLTGLGAEFVGVGPLDRGLRSASPADGPTKSGPRPDDPAAALRSVVPGGVDGLLDAAVVGAPALGAVRDGGVFVAVLPPAAPPAERGIRVETVGVRSDGARLRDLVRLVERGGLTLRVARTLPFAQAAQAHARFAEGGVRGRLVLTFGECEEP